MKNKYYLLFCLLTFQLPLFSQSAQQLRIDSLRKQLPALDPTARVDCLNQLASFHWSLPDEVHRGDSMYHYALKAHREAVKIGYQYGTAMSLIKLAEYEIFQTKNMAKANDYLNQAIAIGEKLKNHRVLGRAHLIRCDLGNYLEDGLTGIERLKVAYDHFVMADDKEGELEVSTWLCMSYANEGKYELGFDYCDKCVQLSKLITPQHSAWHHELVQWSFINMAELYKAVGDYETSMKYLKKSDRYAIDQKLSWDMDILKSEVYCEMGQYDSALLYWQRWEKDYSSYGLGHQAYGNNCLAEIYLRTEQYEKARKVIEGSIATFRKGNKTVPLLRSLLLSAKIYVKQERWDAALKHATEGFVLAEKENIRPSVIDGYELLSKIYHAQGKDDKAYDNLKQYTVLKDSVLNRQFLWRLNTYKKASEDEKKKASIELLNKDNDLKDIQLKQENLQKRFLMGGIVALLFIGFFIFRALRLKQNNEKLQRGRLENELTVQKLESEKKQAQLRQQASELEMQALRAQISPHFIFNCLSSINRFILKNESEAASDYLTRFSRLIRLVLINSKKSMVTLDDELEMIRLYIEMERLRFNDTFDFIIHLNDDVDVSAISIPPLLLQPFVENAIWHGLMNKEGHGQLTISFTSDQTFLTCTIADNGVGRKNAASYRSRRDVKGKSMGIQITTDRLAKLNQEIDRDAFYQVEDLYDGTGRAAGTKVCLKIRLAHSIQDALVGLNNYA